MRFFNPFTKMVRRLLKKYPHMFPKMGNYAPKYNTMNNSKSATLWPGVLGLVRAIPKFKRPKMDPAKFPWLRYLFLTVICVILAGMMHPNTVSHYMCHLSSSASFVLWCYILATQTTRNYEAKGLIVAEIIITLCDAMDAGNDNVTFFMCIIDSLSCMGIQLLGYYLVSKIVNYVGGNGGETT